jgi:hypothetical protein
MSQAPYDIDDLPRFSPWPARLLAIDPWENRYKTPQEVTREYEYEKWGPLLKKLKESGQVVSVEEVDEWWFKDTPPGLCSNGNEFQLMSLKEAHKYYTDLVANVLRQRLPASALVELGCGYGSIILGLAKREPFKGMRIIAGEYTASGVILVTRLAIAQGLEITAGHCDFTVPGITALEIPPEAIIFTSYATPYVPKLSADFVRTLADYQPRAVIHIEPCYEHCDRQTILGLLRRRYIEVNDYNTNLVAILHQQQELGLIRLLEENPTVFGVNPLLAASVLVWRPNR